MDWQSISRARMHYFYTCKYNLSKYFLYQGKVHIIVGLKLLNDWLDIKVISLDVKCLIWSYYSYDLGLTTSIGVYVWYKNYEQAQPFHFLREYKIW